MTKIFKINDFNLFYKNNHDGGGTSFGQDFIRVLNAKYGSKKFNRCLDWCSGPGFIGISLLVNGFCSHVTLMDSNIDVFNFTKKSLRGTRYRDFVSMLNLSTIKDLADYERFDLIVSNPPHFSNKIFWQTNTHPNDELIYLDENWNIHHEFFQNIKSHLSDDGIIILQESQWGCNIDTFDLMLDQGGLMVKDYYPQTVDHFYPIFYLEITHK
jgi:methylase of polypeptide subunit release factors